MSALAIVAVLAMIGGATFAGFTAETAVEGNSFEAGTVEIELVNRGSASGTSSNVFSVDVDAMKPGDNVRSVVYQLNNRGTVAANAFADFTNFSVGPDFGEQVWVKIQSGRRASASNSDPARCQTPTHPNPNALVIWQGTLAELVDQSIPLPRALHESEGMSADAPLDPAVDYHYTACMQLRFEFLDDDGQLFDNDDAQGQSAEFDILFRLEQA